MTKRTVVAALAGLLAASGGAAQLLGPLQNQQYGTQSLATSGYSLSNTPATTPGSTTGGLNAGGMGYGTQGYGMNGAAPLSQGLSSDGSTSLLVGASSVGGLSSQGSDRIAIVQPQRLGDTQEMTDDAMPRDPRFAAPPALPGEFERYVERVVGRKLPRFGASLLLPPVRGFAAPSAAAVPADYRLRPGDQVDLFVTGSVDSQLRLAVDNEGRLQVPKVGAVSVAGARYGDLRALLARAIGREYRNFEVSVGAAPARLRAIRVYVTGYAVRPGAYTVSALSTLANAVLAAGGPTAGGSFRMIELRRGGRLVTSFDLYDLLLRGDTRSDAVLEDGDVLFVAPVGAQVAVTGSVNGEAILEAKAGETLGDVVRYAGGLTSVADPSRAIVARIGDLDASGWRELPLPEASAAPVRGGDILRILSVTDFARPRERQALLVTIEGEVGKPGHYYLPAGASLDDALRLAGGLTPQAYVYGAEFDRMSVREQQRQGLAQALDEVELSVTTAPLRSSASDLGDNSNRATQIAAAQSYIQRLRQQQPQGRVVLDLAPDATALPAGLPLENDDRLYVPPRPSTASVFGAVYRPGSFLVSGRTKVGDFIERAGGAQRVADRGDIFVVRASGEVLTRRKGALNATALPGDVVFVPVKTQSTSVWAKIRDVASIVLGLGVTAATINALAN